jgi:NADH-quinone oxidoreductase subunit G
VAAADLGAGQLEATIGDFYLTNPIARASELMAELSAQARARRERPVAAE